MGIYKRIIDLVRRLLSRNFWQTHIVKATGDKKSLKDVTIHYIIQSIQTESIKPRSQDTNTGILKRQSSSQWSKGILTYIKAITKNEYELTKMLFTTYYAVLVHHIKFHLETFAQTPPGNQFCQAPWQLGQNLWLQLQVQNDPIRSTHYRFNRRQRQAPTSTRVQ